MPFGHRRRVREGAWPAVGPRTERGSAVSGALTAEPARGRRLADLSVKVKILAAVSVAAVVAAVVGVVGLLALQKAAGAAQLMYTSSVASVRAVGNLRGPMLQARVDIGNHALAPDAAGKAKYEQAFRADLQAFTDAVTAYTNTRPTGDPAVVADLSNQWNSYRQIALTKQIPDSDRGDLTAWLAVRNTETTPIVTKLGAEITTLLDQESADAAKHAAEAESAYLSSRTASILILLIGVAAAMTVGYVIARAIVGSLSRVRHVCDGLAAGDLTRIAGLSSRDEPGQMGQALDAAMARLRQTIATISGSAGSLSAESERMSQVSTQIAASAEETTAQAQAVSAAAEQISRSVDTVSAGSEQMGASIREISQNATEAAQVAGEAVTLATTTSATMNKLGESSAEIGNVIKTITAIAEQTNLLALNATIEAARAGEMGKGFAVVASEVKDLAQETARATEDISRRVEAIQNDTQGAVTAIEQISQVIARISDYQTTIASAVEEQTATTGEMNRSVSEAATGTGEIAENITGVAEAARLTSQGVTGAQQAAEAVARMSGDLRQLVDTFDYGT